MFTALRDTYFTTATILRWYPLLKNDHYKDIIIGALRFCVEQKRAYIFAFTIMEHHIHIVWEILPPYTLRQVQQNMLKFTAHQILAHLVDNHEEDILIHFLVRHKDRHFQIWKKNPLSIDLFNAEIFEQKIKYIHTNRMRRGKGEFDEEYKYSSAAYYATGVKNWDFLTPSW